MRKVVTNHLLIILGWFFVLLGLVGVIVPILPTTPFMILAAAIFSRSSPRFHQMLLNNRWFGEVLKDWEERGVLARSTKRKSTFMIVLAFLISIAILYERPALQLMLVGIGATLLFFLWRIKEDTENQ